MLSFHKAPIIKSVTELKQKTGDANPRNCTEEMLWHILSCELLPVHSLLYCLVLIFVSAIKFFLVFLHGFGYFKLLKSRIELLLYLVL